MRAIKTNEGVFDDEGNKRALSTWTNTFITKDFDKYIITIEGPVSIEIEGEDKHKLQYLLNKYRIKYEVKTKDPIMSESILKFNDGVEFDTSGELRVEHRFDGYYVVGNGYLIPIDSPEEGETIISQMKERDQ